MSKYLDAAAALIKKASDDNEARKSSWLAGVSFPRGRAVVESHCTSMRIALDLVDPEGPSDEH